MAAEDSAGPCVSLDELDLRLIQLLEAEPRRTHTSLATGLGISRPTVGSMLQRLTDAGVIETVCLADPGALGFKMGVFFGLNVMPGALMAVADALGALPSIHYVALSSGPFDLVSFGFFKGWPDLVEFLTGPLGRIAGIRQYETITCQELNTSPALLADSPAYRPSEREASLDKLDLALIGVLQRFSTESASSIAARLGASKPTVLRRMKRLLEEGIIRFATRVNAAVLGYEGDASIGIKVAPGHMKRVAEEVAKFKRVHTVALCTGRYDVLAWVIMRDQRELMQILTEEIGSIPGIISTETVINLKRLKETFIIIDWQGELWKGVKHDSSGSIALSSSGC